MLRYKNGAPAYRRHVNFPQMLTSTCIMVMSILFTTFASIGMISFILWWWTYTVRQGERYSPSINVALIDKLPSEGATQLQSSHALIKFDLEGWCVCADKSYVTSVYYIYCELLTLSRSIIPAYNIFSRSRSRSRLNLLKKKIASTYVIWHHCQMDNSCL